MAPRMSHGSVDAQVRLLRTTSKPLASLPLEQLPAPTHCGRLKLAKKGSLSLVAVPSEMSEFWVELRGSVLCVFNDQHSMVRNKALDLTFCWKAQPPPPSSGWSCSPEMVTANEGLLDGHTLVLYTSKGIYSGQCHSADELAKWTQAILLQLEAMEGTQEMSARAKAHNKLHGLIWSQVLAHASQLQLVVDGLHGVGFCDTDQIREREQLSGWLLLRIEENGAVTHEKYFFGLSGSTLSWYENKDKWTPIDLVALQFVTLSTRGINYHQYSFMLETPLRQLELRASNAEELGEWSDAILAAQETSTSDALSGRRTKSLVKRLFKKGKSTTSLAIGRHRVGAGPLAAADGGSHRDSVGDNTAVETSEVELSTVMNNAQLREMLTAFANKKGAAAEIKLLDEMRSVTGVTLPSKEKMSELSANQRKAMLRLSQSIDSESSADSESFNSETGLLEVGTSTPHFTSAMRRSYTTAAQKVEVELLPQFCQTEDFRAWVRAQQELDELEVVLAAIMHQPKVLRSFRDFLGNELQAELAMLEVVERMLSNYLTATETAKLAKQAMAMHLEAGARKPVSVGAAAKEALEAAMAALPEDEGNGKRAIPSRAAFASKLTTAFQDAAHDVLLALPAQLRSFHASREAAEAWQLVQQAELNSDQYTHWVHCNSGFNAFRGWLAETHANENVDFVKEVVAFKQMEDVNATKDRAVSIYKKFVSDGSLSQICLPSPILKVIEDGLQPRFPSASLFDDAIDHVTTLLKQERWPSFTETAQFKAARPQVHKTLKLDEPTTIFLQVRTSQNCRQVVRLHKKCIVIGDAADSDLVVAKMSGSAESFLRKSSGGVTREYSAILWVEPASGGCKMKLMWGNAAGLAAGTHFVAFKEIFYLSDMEASFHAGSI